MILLKRAFVRCSRDKSILTQILSQEIATMEEFRSNENKRSDVKVPSTIASFRAFNGITFSIVTKPSLNEKTCNHIDAAIDGYMFMNTAIGLAWKKNVEGKLVSSRTDTIRITGLLKNCTNS